MFILISSTVSPAPPPIAASGLVHVNEFCIKEIKPALAVCILGTELTCPVCVIVLLFTLESKPPPVI